MEQAYLESFKEVAKELKKKNDIKDKNVLLYNEIAPLKNLRKTESLKIL